MEFKIMVSYELIAVYRECSEGLPLSVILYERFMMI